MLVLDEVSTRLWMGRKETHCLRRVKHCFSPFLRFAARAANDFCPAQLVFTGLRTLIRNTRTAVQLVESELLDELGPRVGRCFELLDEILAVAFVVENLCNLSRVHMKSLK